MMTLTQSPRGGSSRFQKDPTGTAAYRAMLALQQAVDASNLEASLLHLVKLRVSQLNGCAYCVDMHVREAKADGEREERLHLVSVWREAPVFAARERAALLWAEKLTCVAGKGAVPQDSYEAVETEFEESELLDLTLAVVAINGWNRFNLGFHVIPEIAEA